MAKDRECGVKRGILECSGIERLEVEGLNSLTVFLFFIFPFCFCFCFFFVFFYNRLFLVISCHTW